MHDQSQTKVSMPKPLVNTHILSTDEGLHSLIIGVCNQTILICVAHLLRDRGLDYLKQSKLHIIIFWLACSDTESTTNRIHRKVLKKSFFIS
jgi:hypothetical protein